MFIVRHAEGIELDPKSVKAAMKRLQTLEVKKGNRRVKVDVNQERL